MADPKSNAVVARLTPEVYGKLEREAFASLNVVPKTDLEAGFSLGVQHVLKMIRNGITINA